MYGIIKPTNPIVPVKDTMLPTIKAENKIICFLDCSISIPMCVAFFSPNSIVFRVLPFDRRNRKLKNRIVLRIAIEYQLAAAKLPRVQNVRFLSSSSVDK